MIVGSDSDTAARADWPAVTVARPGRGGRKATFQLVSTVSGATRVRTAHDVAACCSADVRTDHRVGISCPTWARVFQPVETVRATGARSRHVVAVAFGATETRTAQVVAVAFAITTTRTPHVVAVAFDV